MQDLHQRYGEVVRVGPNELVFTHPEAIQDIYGLHPQASHFHKDPARIVLPVNSVYTVQASDGKSETHSRQRRLLDVGFTASAVREQEPLLQKHVNLLVERLKSIKAANPGAHIDIKSWMNYTTFDITGDLTFGESFGCLEGGVLHPWIGMIFTAIKASIFITAAR